jgi:hypothetical protein
MDPLVARATVSPAVSARPSPDKATAISVTCDTRFSQVVTRLASGLELRFSFSRVPALSVSALHDVCMIRVSPDGKRLVWPRLGLEMDVARLLREDFTPIAG